MSDTVPDPSAGRQAEQARMLANRLSKSSRHLRKWARREGVSCYRLYDRDIPEIPLAIDWYEGRLHVAQYERRGGEPDARADAGWADAMVQAAASALGVDPATDAFLKLRRRQSGTSQYEKLGDEGARFVVHEGGLRFLVNLSDYLDTGLFLDHRLTRAELRAHAGGARVLNLFAYTGAFSVYAAAGGAAETLSMDLSNTYLAWAEENLALNGFSSAARSAHRLLRQDCCAYLREERDLGAFDLAVVDPPSFSTSKAMEGTFDVLRDHVWLLERALTRLRRGGVLYFSTNRRGFALGAGAEQLDAHVEDITVRTIPPDFQRNSRIHRCYRITRR
jgi:23S rRNA G2069 N7-methylase RlmK/C1962 C5-methylase RlmI